MFSVNQQYEYDKDQVCVCVCVLSKSDYVRTIQQENYSFRSHVLTSNMAQLEGIVVGNSFFQL